MYRFKITINGKTYHSISEIHEDYPQVKRRVIRDRIREGYPASLIIRQGRLHKSSIINVEYEGQKYYTIKDLSKKCGLSHRVIKQKIEDGDLDFTCGAGPNRGQRGGHNKLSLQGQKFGKLTVLRQDGSYKTKHNRSAKWLCRCECGTELHVSTRNLKLGQKQCWQCGVIRRQKKVEKDE
jgi:hypothetical protein